MKQQNILILGAGVYQLKAIAKAQQLGYRVIVASYDIDQYPGSKIADVAVEVDTTDVAGILNLAKQYNIAAIFTTGTDVALKALGKVNDELGLAGIGYDACVRSTDKSSMKRAFVEYGAPTAAYYEIYSLQEASKAAEKIGYPVMVKAIDTSGSRGISQAKSRQDIFQCWQIAQQYTHKGDPVIIEKYLEGEFFGAQAVVYQGKIELILPHNDTITPPPVSFSLGHSYPWKDSDTHQQELEDVVTKGLRALQIDNSAANFDLMKTNKGIKIVEVGARMGANCLPENTQVFTGVDATTELIKIAIGENPNFKNTENQPVASMILTADKTGILEKIIVPDKIRQDTSLIELLFDVEPGDKVNKFVIGPDRVGQLVVSADTWEAAEKKAQRFAKMIKFVVR